MNKVAEFYAKAMGDEAAKAEFLETVGDKAPDRLTDAELEKLGAIAKKLGFDITVEEIRNYLAPLGELSDDALGDVAGGSSDPMWYWRWVPFPPSGDSSE